MKLPLAQWKAILTRRLTAKEVALVAVAGGVVWILGLKGVAAPRLCAACHEMRPEYYTWRASEHRLIPCGTCHRDRRWDSPITNLKALGREAYLHVRKKYYLPIELKSKIGEGICLQCHSRHRRVTPPGDLIVPHDKHLENEVACVECHAGVVHGRVAEREETIAGDFWKWDEVTGRIQMVSQYKGISMQGCLNCHRTVGASTACEACHERIVKPDSHLSEYWLQEHGKEALAGVKACDRCHSFTRSSVVVKASSEAGSYARSNDYCYNCHQNRPAGHGPEWKATHGRASGDREGCLVCHNAMRPQKTDRAAKTYCQQCHTNRHRGGPGPNHPVPLAPGQRPEKRCMSCHSERVCGQCHTIP